MSTIVLIVGAGPVGLAMAAELARYGVSVRLIEKAPQRTDKSKALVVWSRTLELLDRAGCGEKFLQAGSKVTAANIMAKNQQIAHIRLDEVQTPHPYALMLPQSETERLLEDHLNTCGVQVERQVELTEFTVSTENVTASLRHADGRMETISADWLIGCDGAHSTVRHKLGMEFVGDTLQSDWILADVHLTGLTQNPLDVNTYWHTDGALALFPISPGRYRIVADKGETKTEQHPADPSLSEVQAVLDERGPGGVTVSDPIWLSAFRINERKVINYRDGRVFLAGDAAHVHSPAGGQGMNTGIQDACNLAWKLALALKKLARENLMLDSYSIERSAVGEKVLKDSGRLTRLATLQGEFVQFLRNHVASFVFGFSPVLHALAENMTELSIGYPKSPLTDASSSAQANPAPGNRAPVDANHPVGAGPTPRFAIFASPDPAGEKLIERYRDLMEPKIRPPFHREGIWLVRPDGYVAASAKSGNWPHLEKYLNLISYA